MSDLSDTLDELVRALQDSDVYELELEDAGHRVRVHRRASLVSAGMPVEENVSSEVSVGPQVVPVTSPLVGTFYRAESPGSEPLAARGMQVDSNTVVGIVEALQVLTEIVAGHEGTIAEVLATDGEPVEYGQPLFLVSVNG